MLSLKAQPRELKGRKTKKIKEQGLIPAVVYGHGFKSKSIQVLALDFKKVFKEAGESSIINLEIEGDKPIKVLVYDMQRHPLKDNLQHIDFYKIKEGEKIKVETGLKFIGEAPAVKELGGVLFNNLSEVEIECLPEDLIHEIEVDISVLKT
ncbi:50S ribosomal protein L25, partial [Candidatus Parcubacteria bacterium]|nr:50S ribosomal protein L25 [Candidatus Parcubacteria bacterium]